MGGLLYIDLSFVKCFSNYDSRDTDIVQFIYISDENVFSMTYSP